MSLYERLREEYGPGPFPEYHIWGECFDGAKSCLMHGEVTGRKKEAGSVSSLVRLSTPLTLDRWVGGLDPA